MVANSGENMLTPALAILDWGIGGIDFYRIFKERYPKASICYISDSGAIPYGKQQKEQLRQRLTLIVNFLKQRGVSRLVVACNAMSTVLPDMPGFETMADFQVTGVIGPAVSAVLAHTGDQIGIVGGRRTILSGAYSRPLRINLRSVTQRIAQPLSALIERGEKDSALFRDTLDGIMRPPRKTDILVLACTHYPAAQKDFEARAPGALVINPSAETFKWVEKHWRFKDSPIPDVFYTTGNPEEMRSAALAAFGVRIGAVAAIAL